MNLCQLLDTPGPLGNDWKQFAAELGLTVEEVKVLENKPCGSHTEQVLTLLETTFIDKCNVDFLYEVFQTIRRPDCIELLKKAEQKST